ncbi:outer membrane protein transport protein [Hymenobacter saemangeumensis]|uniref:Outer membrane protein transport protein n=1 Tax=Hymenobacter saemangeumensis TaxID=1084522 RepID=A0ABP8HZ42_9BACT
MKKRTIWLSLALAVGQASHAFAQDASDALRYSRQQFGGPARTLGIAGANVALGADFGSLSSNPAGLGLFQKSELHLTPGLGLGQGEGRMEGSSSAAQTENKNSFHIASAGLVLTGRKADTDQSSNWRGGSLAFGFTRTADFNTASRYGATLNERSIGGRTYTAAEQSYLASLEGTAPPSYFSDIRRQSSAGDYETADALAYGAYLTNIVRSRNGSDSAIVMRRMRGPIGQSESIVSRGSMSQFDIGYGASYRDRLYIGAALGIVSSNYRTTRSFTETETDPTTRLNSYTLRDDLSTSGRGVNLRVGAILRASDFLRVGASIQTPTFLSLTDTYNSRITTDFSAQGSDNSPALPASVVGVTSVDALENIYDYNLTTPFRANGGAALTIGKIGFLTGDVEYVGYNQARLSNAKGEANGDDYSFSKENSSIRSRYRSVVNLRFGGELRYDVFRVRAGYARYGDPYQTESSVNRIQSFYTAGAGLRQGSFFLDAAVMYQAFDQAYTPYTLSNGLEPLIKVNNNRYTTSITAGVTF